MFGNLNRTLFCAYLLLFTALAYATDVQVPVSAAKCTIALTDETAAIEELAQFYLEVQDMPASPFKTSALADLKSKYLEMRQVIGETLPTRFLERVAKLKPEVSKRITQVAQIRETQEEQLALRWHEIENLPALDSVLVVKYVNENTIVYPDNEKLITYDLVNKRIVRSYAIPELKPNARIELSLDKRYVYTPVKHWDNTSRLFKIDLSQPTLTSHPNLYYNQGGCVAKHSPAMERLAFGVGTHLSIVDTSTMKELSSHDLGLTHVLVKMRFSQDGRYIVTLAASGNFTVIDALTGNEIEFPDEMRKPLWLDVAFVPGKDILLFLDSQGHPLAYDLAAQKTALLKQPSWKYGRKLRVAMDGKTLVLFNDLQAPNPDRVLAAYNMETGEEVDIGFPSDWKNIRLAAESEDGEKLFFIHNNKGIVDKGFLLDLNVLIGELIVNPGGGLKVDRYRVDNPIFSPSKRQILFPGSQNHGAFRIW